MTPRAAELLERLADPEWRIRNLYVIDVGDGKVTALNLRPEQDSYLKRRHTRNKIPKARKLGISTVVVLKNGDSCIFGLNYKAAIIDRSEADAWEKLAIFKFAWDHAEEHPDPDIAALWAVIKATNPLTTDNNGELAWSNGAMYQAGASFTGRNPQALHVSELGPICDEAPLKGERILQGSINAVLSTGIVDVETTMRAGQHGACARIFKLAKDCVGLDKAGELGAVEWRLHFFSWLGHPDYRMPGRKPTNGATLDYFRELQEKHGITATPEQMAWYESKAQEQGEKMMAEYPSTIEECDKATMRGAIYPQMASLRARGGVRKFEAEPGYPLFAFFDLGTEDNLAAWLIQPTPRDVNILDWSSGEGLGALGAVQIVQRWGQQFGGVQTTFIPHDGDLRDKGSGLSFRAQMTAPGLLAPASVVVVPRTPDVWAGIQEVRRRIPRMWFHERCDKEQKIDGQPVPGGVGRLEGYRKRETKDGLITSTPVPDICSHTADALRTFAEADALGMVKVASAARGGSYADPAARVRALTGIRR